MLRRRSKYPSLGILEAIERAIFGGKYGDDFGEYLDKPFSSDKVFISKKLYALRRGGFVKRLPSGRLLLTKKGQRHVNFSKLENLKLDNQKRDGRKRVIIFDIPEEKRSARELLRAKLNEFGCRHLQKSVYVTDCVCEKEIEELAQLLDIGGHVTVIVAKSFGNKEGLVKKWFG